jgi:6-phosphogluconate dehydrogenase (decarboxylating)
MNRETIKQIGMVGLGRMGANMVCRSAMRIGFGGHLERTGGRNS